MLPMQSIFRFPCFSEFAPTKFADKIALDKFRQPQAMVDLPMLNQLKRKLSDGPDTASPPPGSDKKLRSEPTVAPSPALVNAPAQQAPRDAQASTESGASVASSQLRGHPQCDINAKPVLQPLSTAASPLQMDAAFPSSLTPLQQTIENEFNMQILMKHNELRLIEQELAKCQIALEQLRRCEVRPFPGSDRPALSVSEGTGPALAPPAGFSRPTHPAPYGVTDGPYSRHYRQWLLYDPLFDSTPFQATAHGDAHADTRSTRYNGVPKKSFGRPAQPSSRRSESLHNIPNYPSVGPKDKSTPLVLRRSTDGKLVKLICNNCHRGDFSSIQGFLNHCRIAHKVDYKSHDLAAIDCGHALDDAELAKLPVETHALTAPKPTASRAASVSSTPIRGNFVHPLNTTAGATASAPQMKPHLHATPVRSLSSAVTSDLPPSPFKASAQVPRLSQLFAKHNRGGDLEQAVAAATQKVDIGRDDVLMSDASQESSPVSAAPTAHRQPHGFQDTADTASRPASRKGHRQPAQRPRPAPLMPSSSSASSLVEDFTQSPNGTSSATYSPHAADSNPGLVSDHEDDDHGSASEEEAPHGSLAHPLSVARHCADNMQIDIDDDDEIDQHGVIIRRNSITAPEARSIRSAGNSSKKMGGGAK